MRNPPASRAGERAAAVSVIGHRELRRAQRDYHVLLVFSHGGALRPTQLEYATGLTPREVSTALSQLRSTGHITPGQQDGTLSITTAGLNRLQALQTLLLAPRQRI